MKQNIHKIICITLLFSSTLLAFEGKVFSVTGNQVTITGDGVAHLKAGQKFAVFNGTAKTGEIVVLQASHTQAKAKVISGTAAKDAAVREILEKKGVVSGNFRDNGDGTVTDTKTKLVWQKCSMGQNNDETCSGEALTYNWKDAKNVCNNMKVTQNKWRLPDIEELKTIIYCSDGIKTENLRNYSMGNPYKCGWSGGDDYEKEYIIPVIEEKAFPNTNKSGYWTSSYWTITPPTAWIVYFSNGSDYISNIKDAFYVRCVSN